MSAYRIWSESAEWNIGLFTLPKMQENLGPNSFSLLGVVKNQVPFNTFSPEVI